MAKVKAAPLLFYTTIGFLPALSVATLSPEVLVHDPFPLLGSHKLPFTLLNLPSEKHSIALYPWYGTCQKHKEREISYSTVINPRKINMILNGSRAGQMGSWSLTSFFSVPAFVSL